GTGLGGAHIDEMVGASSVPGRVLDMAPGAIAKALKEAGLADDNGASGGTRMQRWRDKLARRVPSIMRTPLGKPVLHRVMPTLRNAVEEALSPIGMRAKQKSLLQVGASTEPVRATLASGRVLTVKATVVAVPRKGSVRPAAGLADADLEYPGETWLPTHSTWGRAHRAAGALKVPFEAAHGTDRKDVENHEDDLRIPLVWSPAVTGEASYRIGTSVTRGPWMASDPHFKITGPTEGYEADVDYQIVLEVEVSGRGTKPVVVTENDSVAGSIRVQAPHTATVGPDESAAEEGAVEQGAAEGDAAEEGAPKQGAPVELPAVYRPLEVRGTRELRDGVDELLKNVAQAARPGMRGRRAAPRLGIDSMNGARLEPEPLRIRLHDAMDQGVALEVSEANGPVLGEVKVSTAAVHDAKPWPARTMPVSFDDEGQVWQLHEGRTTSTTGWKATGELGVRLEADLPGVGAGNIEYQRVAAVGRSSSTTRQDTSLPRLGWLMEWSADPEKPTTVETYGLEHRLEFIPSAAGRASGLSSTGPVVVAVPHAVDVMIPAAEHMLRRLNAIPLSTAPVPLTDPDLVRRVAAGLPIHAAAVAAGEGTAGTDSGPDAGPAGPNAGAVGPKAGPAGPGVGSDLGGPDAAAQPVAPSGKGNALAAIRQQAVTLLGRGGGRFSNNGGLPRRVEQVLSAEFAGGVVTAGRVRVPLSPQSSLGTRHDADLEITVV
ncbi:MAG: hypothetical protein ACRCXL_12070, partial [Dermatophilaceae bacterium]